MGHPGNANSKSNPNSRFLTPFATKKANGFGMTIKDESRRISEGEALRYKGKAASSSGFAGAQGKPHSRKETTDSSHGRTTAGSE